MTIEGSGRGIPIGCRCSDCVKGRITFRLKKKEGEDMPKSPEEWADTTKKRLEATGSSEERIRTALTEQFSAAQRQDWDRAIDYVQNSGYISRPGYSERLKAAWSDAFRPSLLPCPFTDKHEEIGGVGAVVVKPAWFAYCGYCGACGPRRSTEEEAIAA